jgi:hypothetical protein
VKEHPTGLPRLNLVLVCACVITFTLTEAITGVKARGTCNPPPLLSSTYPGTFWAANTIVNVEIDDAWDSDDRDALASGTAKWNDVSIQNCSYVTLTGFTPRHFTNYSSYPPADTFWFQRADHGQNFAAITSYNSGGIPLRLISAKAKVKPSVTNIVK